MKTALITGASRGIGAAAALELSKLGYAIAVNYRENSASADKTVETITDSGGTALPFKADIRNPADIDNMIDEIHSRLGDICVLVNNAGISHIGLLQDMTDSEITNLIGVDLTGALLCSKRVIPDMLKSHSGVIINIASMWGEVGASCETVYSAAKAGVIGFTKALAKELGPSGIRVNCVSPGVIDTDMNKELSDETMSDLCEDTPLLRIGTPADVGRTIAFLASEKASFITGQVISVNGGII